jgi:hypothetical protein
MSWVITALLCVKKTFGKDLYDYFRVKWEFKHYYDQYQREWRGARVPFFVVMAWNDLWHESTIEWGVYEKLRVREYTVEELLHKGLSLNEIKNGTGKPIMMVKVTLTQPDPVRYPSRKHWPSAVLQ